MHLRNAPAKGMLDLGYSQGYKYPHDYPGNVCAQQYLPDEMVGTVYYRPNDNGYEKKVQEFLSERDKQLRS
jgi:putative ATPase